MAYGKMRTGARIFVVELHTACHSVIGPLNSFVPARHPKEAIENAIRDFGTARYNLGIDYVGIFEAAQHLSDQILVVDALSQGELSASWLSPRAVSLKNGKPIKNAEPLIEILRK